MSAQLWSSVIRGLKEPPPAPAKACDANHSRMLALFVRFPLDF